MGVNTDPCPLQTSGEVNRISVSAETMKTMCPCQKCRHVVTAKRQMNKQSVSTQVSSVKLDLPAKGSSINTEAVISFSLKVKCSARLAAALSNQTFTRTHHAQNNKNKQHYVYNIMRTRSAKCTK